MEDTPPPPPWLDTMERRDPQFAGSYLAMRQSILKDGAIPAKYKLLMGMITDAIAAHPDGVASLADDARAAGASEAEITEAVEVAYLYGGTAGLVMGLNAFRELTIAGVTRDLRDSGAGHHLIDRMRRVAAADRSTFGTNPSAGLSAIRSADEERSVNALNVPGPDRRGSPTAPAGKAAAAAGLTAWDAQTAAAAPGSSLTEAVLAAFQTHRVVAIGDAHAGQEIHDLLLTMLSDPRLYGTANDIVVEFGDAFYQDTLDKFILSDEPVDDAGLRLVWRNTTQSPNIVLDCPVYEQVYRRVRAINWTLPADKKIRVLAGEPPFDWSTVTSASQIPYRQRDPYPASLAGQSLAKGRRVLLIYGGMHLLHRPPDSGRTITTLIEQKTGIRTYVIVPLRPLTTDPGGVFPRLAAYPRGTVIPTTGSWLGNVSAGDILPGATASVNGQDPKFINPWCGMTFGQLVDAGLYVGQPGELTASWPNPAIYLDPVYWAELERRDALKGNSANPPLNTFRQQRPPAYPLAQAGPAC